MTKYFFLVMLCFFSLGFAQEWYFLDRINECTYYVKELSPDDKIKEIWYKTGNCKKGVDYFDGKSKIKKNTINGHELTLELFDCNKKNRNKENYRLQQ